MADSIELTAGTVEQAIREALDQLGAREDDVTIEVLATPRAGVLGLGVRQAKVRVSRRVSQAASSAVQSPPPAPPPTPRTTAERPADSQSTAPSRDARDQRAPRPPENREQSRTDNRAARAPERPQPRDRDPNRASPPRPASDAALDDDGNASRPTANLEEQGREAIAILRQILELMGERADVRTIDSDPESVELEIHGDGSGILIGRHGQTLDALEYVVNRILSRRIKDSAPISLETESYRARRRGQLHRMALSMGERAKRDHQAVKLDPMPPRDRRVVHLALKDDPMITTRSAGDGYLRAIEILPVGGGNRERGDGQAQNQGRGRRRERERQPERERHPERERQTERDRERQPDRNDALGEQGGFKHGQKRIV